MRLLGGILALLFAFACQADAAPCQPVTISAGFGQTFTGTQYVGGFLWDSNTFFMYVMNLTQQYATFIQVPQSTAQNFVNAKNPDQFYQQNVMNSFHEALAAETCVPLANENQQALILSK